MSIALFFIVSGLLGAELVLASYSLAVAAAAWLPLTGIVVWACRWRVGKIVDERENYWRDQVRRESERWQKLLAEHVPLLPVLAGRIGDTSQSVEETMAQVCAGFIEIASRVKQSVDETTGLLEACADYYGERQAHVRNVIEDSGKTIRDTLDRIVQGSGRAMRAVYQFDDIRKGIERVSQILKEVDRLGHRAKDLSPGIAVATSFKDDPLATPQNDITELAEHAAHASTMMHELLPQIDGKLHLIDEELKFLASTELSALMENREEMEHAIESWSRENDELRLGASQAGEQRDKIAREVSQAITAMQFQDVVKHKLEHIAQTLVETEKALYIKIVGLAAIDIAQDRTDDHAGRRSDTYPTAKQRREVVERIKGPAADSTPQRGRIETS
jgi:hypothetical protein